MPPKNILDQYTIKRAPESRSKYVRQTPEAVDNLVRINMIGERALQVSKEYEPRRWALMDYFLDFLQ